MKDYFAQYLTCYYELLDKYESCYPRLNSIQKEYADKEFAISLKELKKQFAKNIRNANPGSLYKFAFIDDTTCKVQSESETILLDTDSVPISDYIKKSDTTPEVEPDPILAGLAAQVRIQKKRLLELECAVLRKRMELYQRAADMTTINRYRRNYQAMRGNCAKLIAAKHERLRRI